MSHIFGVCALFWHPSGDRNVLSISRRNKPEDIGLIGGKVDPGETPEQAIIRECYEETGVGVDPADLTHIFDRVDSTVTDRSYARCFLVRKWTGHPRAMENGFKARWVTVPEILDPRNTTFGRHNRMLFVHLEDQGTL